MSDSLKYRSIIRCFNSSKIILFELDQTAVISNWNISKIARDSCRRSIKSIFSSFPSNIWSELCFYPSGRCRVIENSQHFFVNILWSWWNFETEHGLWPLVEYCTCTKFGTDWSNGADLYKGQTYRYTFVYNR